MTWGITVAPRMPAASSTLAEVGIVATLGAMAMRGLPTEGRIQVLVVASVTSLLFWHLLHLLAGTPSH